MGKTKKYMAIDYGTRSGLAMLGAFDGENLGLEVMHRFPVRATTMLGTSYWDFPGMLINAKRGLSVYSERHGRELNGVACDSWGVDFGILDKTGHLLSNPVHHYDPRTVGLVEKLHAAIPGRSLYQRTGVKSVRYGTLFQLYSMALANSPLLDKAVTMLLMADLASYFLSGTPVQEYTLATTTGMYDAESRDWSRDTILSAKIPPVMVPEIVAPGTVIGPMLDEVAAECGLGQTPIIAPASHSMAGAVAAIPAQSDDWLYIVAGDWDQVGVEVAAPVINDATYTADFTNEGGVDGTIRLLKGIQGLSALEKCLECWSREDGRELEVFEALAMAETADQHSRLFNPDDPALLDVVDMPSALRAILVETGQPKAETRADLVRMCMDSLILSHRHAITQLMGITGRKYGVIHVVGWGSAIPALNQAIADATRIPVKAGPMEAKAIGNLIMQATALGDIASLAEAREVVANSLDIFDYQPTGNGSGWDEAYGKFLKML